MGDKKKIKNGSGALPGKMFILGQVRLILDPALNQEVHLIIKKNNFRSEHFLEKYFVSKLPQEIPVTVMSEKTAIQVLTIVDNQLCLWRNR